MRKLKIREIECYDHVNAFDSVTFALIPIQKRETLYILYVYERLKLFEINVRNKNSYSVSLIFASDWSERNRKQYNRVSANLEFTNEFLKIFDIII
jgi:hypothetical protein